MFEKYRRLAENFCSAEVGPSDVIPVRAEFIVTHLYRASLGENPNLRTFDGEVAVGRNDGREILVSKDLTAAKLLAAKRFTLLHEIGHSELHPGETHFRQRTQPRPLKEHEADWFAVCVSMPRELVIEEFRDRFGPKLSVLTIDDDRAYALTANRLAPSQIRKMSLKQFAELLAKSQWFDHHLFSSLADRFGVSVEAMALRLMELFLVSRE